MAKIEILPTEDVDYVVSVLSNPEIFDGISDDSCDGIAKEDYYKAFKAIPGYFLKVVRDGEDSGLFWLIRKDGGVEAHTALMPNCRGRDAVNATKSAIQWVFQNDKADFIQSYAWSDCPEVKWLCRMLGMHEVKTEPYCHTRKCKPVDITYYKIANPINK